MRSSFVRRGLTAIGAAVLATAALASTATADPGVTPRWTDLVGVGSDTTQTVLNDLSALYNYDTGAARRVASFDASDPATGQTGGQVQIKPGVTIERPNGSVAGVDALRANRAVDFARSSVGPAADTPANLVYLPFAIDDLRYVVDAPATNAPLDVTRDELVRIYNCEATTWSAVRPGLSGDTIAPKIPQAGSGTRALFLEQLGLTAPGACVAEVQEHDHTAVDGNPNAILPFSSARFFIDVPVDETGRRKVVQGNFDGGFIVAHNLYNVVRKEGPGAGVPAGLRPFLGDGKGANGWICGDNARRQIVNNGFRNLPANECGVAVKR
ncbi:substrate-binding domain-containing protein [Actinokineospora auranticolor]|uniref:Periplasmic binding family protein n=1 Tax=Actinokineospora auranticolor TaxID=155976 RepID=A0A2S6GF04_9PSEU|nr:substrate-binding domain-containing protein [Actinokineospora auranticolor]PPK63721.1 periplasmic binding family protein [Actinokineospora auranticolor]